MPSNMSNHKNICGTVADDIYREGSSVASLFQRRVAADHGATVERHVMNDQCMSAHSVTSVRARHLVKQY